MCIKAAKAVGLEFAGVDLNREKMGQTYVTEVNGNPGTGIIDITKKNHFINLIRFVQIKSKKTDTVTAPVPLPDDDKEDKQQQENEEEASIRKYNILAEKDKAGILNYNERGYFLFLKNKLKRF